MKSNTSRYCLSQVIACCILCIWSQRPLPASESVVWNQGPGTGNAFGYLTNQEGIQTLWDSVFLPTSTFVSGFNLFTSPSALPLGGNLYRVSFRLDNQGLPGATFSRQDVAAQSVGYVSPDVYQISLRFEPLLLTAGTTYWVGATSLGFDCGQNLIVAPGDGKMAVQGGMGGVPFLLNDGDQMFQLVAVPEPKATALILLGALGCFVAHRPKG
jgi:hypothetical protein